jgi:Xaa-Pro aminopeptidase
MARALAAANQAGAEQLLITNPVDVGYLTGFLGGDSFLLLGAGEDHRPVIISDFRYEEELHPLKRFCNIHIRTGQMVEAVAALLADLGVGQLGLQSEHVTLAMRRALGRQAKGVELIETAGILTTLRARKDASEVALIQKAVRIGQDALEAVLKVIDKKVGRGGSMTEVQIAALLEMEMKARGSSKPSFESIVAARSKGSLPHYRPGTVLLSRNQPLLIDWGAIWNGYHGDMTRTLCWGKWPRKLADVYRVVLEAHQRAASALRAGRTTVEIDKIARDLIAEAGYGDRFGHGLGHGIGLDIHENPRLTHMADPAPLEAGHVVTIEPGVYLPGVGGVRIENDYLVTDTGAKCLCTMPKDLDWATR